MPKASDVPKDLWDLARTFLPRNLDELARETGAAKRFRGFADMEQILRAFLLYASVNSFKTTAELARSSGLADVSSVAFFVRLRNSEAFLERVLASLMDHLNAPMGYRLLTIDGTSLAGPASKGTDWRVHVAYDPVRGIPCSLSLTDAHGAESLSRHPLQPGRLAVADMGYGTPRNVHAAFEAGSDMLIRIPQRNMRLLGADGEPVDWKALAEQVPVTGPVSIHLTMPVPPDGAGNGWKTKDAIARHPVRLIGVRNQAGTIIWLLTNLNEDKLSNEEACEIYRVRWQVELFFKRLKSLGDLDVFNSREGPTAKATLLAKLILLVLMNLLSDEGQAFSPYGYRIVQTGPKPVARVRMRPQEIRRMPLAEQAEI